MKLYVANDKTLYRDSFPYSSDGVLEIPEQLVPKFLSVYPYCLLTCEANTVTEVTLDEEAYNASLIPDEKPDAPQTQIEQLQQENKLLKAQIQAQTERSDFVEDCIAEMAIQVYGGV